jgi:hypothetical protein
VDWREYKKEWSLPSLRYYLGVCPKGIRKTTIRNFSIAAVPAEIQMGHLTNTNPKW